MGAEADAIAYLNQRVKALEEEISGLRVDVRSLDETLKGAMAIVQSIPLKGGILRAAAAAIGR